MVEVENRVNVKATPAKTSQRCVMLLYSKSRCVNTPTITKFVEVGRERINIADGCHKQLGP